MHTAPLFRGPSFSFAIRLLATMFTMSCPSLRKAIFDAMALSRAFLSTSPTLEAPNAFNQFVKARYADIKQKNPSLKGTDLLRKLGEEYRKLSDAERIQFKVLESIPNATDLTRGYSEKQKKFMYAHRHGMPRKPPCSGLNVFVREKLCDLKGQSIGKVSVRLQEVVKEWNKLSQTEKAAYAEKAQDLRDTYERELAAWASEHGVRFTKNLNLLTSRFYKQRGNQKHPETKPIDLVHTVSTRKSTDKKPKQPSL